MNDLTNLIIIVISDENVQIIMFDVTNWKEKTERITVKNLIFFKENLWMQKRNYFILFTVDQQKKRWDLGDTV